MSHAKTPLTEGEGRVREAADDHSISVSAPGTTPFLHEDRTRQAWLANKKQELQAPANALLDLCELLLHDAHDRGQEDLVKDLEKMRVSSRLLLDMVQEVLAHMPAEDSEAAHRVRHDLRTPLTNIIGLCDLWREEAAEQFLEGFDDDLKKMLSLSQKLLGSIDELLGFGKIQGPENPEIIEEVLEDLRNFRKAVFAEKGSVLVVDDNEINRDTLFERLRRLGHQVTTAANGRQALDILRVQPFDLILLDIIMPELNGFQVLKHLKADPVLCHLPVLMISALDEVDSVVRCIEMGAEDYLPKPINPVLLEARINTCLEKKFLLEQIKKEQKRADDLLHVILPGEIVKELKETQRVRPRRFEDVAVLFCDIVGFTPFCDRSQPEQVVLHLQQLIEAWEEIALRHQVEKIKTIGDAFMAASGLLQKTTDNPVRHCVQCGQEMIAACQDLGTGWNLRVGIHVGTVVAGVIGKRQYLFDLWGDTVNTAARMESHGVPGAVVLSGLAWQQIAHRGRGQSLGLISVKGKGQLEMVQFQEWLE